MTSLTSKYRMPSNAKDPSRITQVSTLSYSPYVIVEAMQAATRMVMPSACGKSFLRYSSSQPHAAQHGSAGSPPLGASSTACSHAGQVQPCGPGTSNRPGVAHVGQN